jgi:hypothetical protein
MNTQLSIPSSYNVANMRFGKVIVGSAGAPGAGPAIKYYRIPISTLNKDGSLGELVFQTEELFSFGVSENKDQATGKVNGYTLPLCMWNKDAPTDNEKAFTQILEDVVEKCKDHLILDETKDEICKYTLERNDLKTLNSFIYRKKEKGKVIEGVGPVLYPKLIESKKNNKIITSIFNDRGQEIDPMGLVGKYCWVKAAVKIESIYVGAKISMQVKVYEAEVRLVETGAKRLLQRPKAEASLTMNVTVESKSPLAQQNDEEDEDDEQIQDEDDATPAKPPTPPPAVVEVPARKGVRKIGTVVKK